MVKHGGGRHRNISKYSISYKLFVAHTTKLNKIIITKNNKACANPAISFKRRNDEIDISEKL